MRVSVQTLWHPRWRSSVPICVVVVLLLVIPRYSWAQTGPAFTIESWEVPTSCGAAGHFAALVRDALGIPEEGSGYAKSLAVAIEISDQGHGFELRLITGSDAERGERVLRAKECEEVLQSAALVLSLSLAPELLYQNESKRTVIVSPTESDNQNSQNADLGTDETNNRQENDAETPDFNPLATATEASIALRSANRSREFNRSFPVSLHLALVSDVGTLPRPGFGLALEASGEGSRFRVALRLVKWGEQDETLDNSIIGQEGGHFDFLESSLFVCRKLFRTSGLCATGSVGRLSASAINIDEPIGQTHPMASLGGSAYWMSHPWGQWRFRVQADLLVNLIRPRYTTLVVEEGTQNSTIEMLIHQPSPLAGRFSASIGAYF